jgi:hypothetical protein
MLMLKMFYKNDYNILWEHFFKFEMNLMRIKYAYIVLKMTYL